MFIYFIVINRYYLKKKNIFINIINMTLKELKSKDHDHIFGSAWVYKTAKADWVKIIPPEIGDIKMSIRSDAHAGWLKCDGSAISRTTYADLWAVIGTNFGAGNGTTTFNLPDARGRVLGGIGTGRNNTDSANLTARALGAKVGAETHTLTVEEMPAHTHTYSGVTGQGNFSGGVDISADEANRPNQDTTSTGGGEPHENMQPTLFIGNTFIFGKHQTDMVPA
jgi:microcystin-dependent protein